MTSFVHRLWLRVPSALWEAGRGWRFSGARLRFAVAGLLLAVAGPAFAGRALAAAETGMDAAPRDGRNEVALRGHAIDVYYLPRSSGVPPLGKILFAPGDGGWRGAAVGMGAAMASWGYDVFALDTKNYLKSFTGTTTLAESDVAVDFYRLAEWAAPRPGERVLLVGWSAGAGLMVLAAADPRYQPQYLGVATLGLSDRNVIGWRWQDDLTYLTKLAPNEPTFSCLALISRLTPVPIAMLQSSHDEFVPVRESRQLFDAAQEPKRYFAIDAQNHRFDGNLAEFHRSLQEALQWLAQVPR